MNKKSKILIVWFREYPWDVRIDKISKSLYNNGFDVEILCRWNFEDKEQEIINEINIFRAGYKIKRIVSAPYHKSYFWKKIIQRRIEQNKPDLVIVRDMYLAEITSNVARKFDIPMILDMAEHYPGAMREWKKYNNNQLKRFFIHNYKLPDKIEKNAVKNSDGIITVCEEQNIRLDIQYNFPVDKIKIVHNTPEKLFNTAKKGIINEHPVLFHHGNLTAEKSLTNFLKGFVNLDKNNNIRFQIAGDGECIEDYKDIVKNGNYKKVLFSGKYEFEKLPELMSEIDIGVLPYQINEFNEHTIHNKIFDYFAAGKPVITSQVSPLIRIIKETESGISIDCENVDEITYFLKNLENYDWHKMAEKSYSAYLNKYNWENDEKQLVDFINEFI